MNYPVGPKKQAELSELFARLGVREADLDEKFIRSQGSGGQNLNKVSTCVALVHRPSGLSVRCQTERSQGLNRFLARRLLLGKIEALQKGAESARRSAAQKIRRQKRRRSRRSRQAMLEAKRLTGIKKSLRRSLRPDYRGE